MNTRPSSSGSSESEPHGTNENYTHFQTVLSDSILHLPPKPPCCRRRGGCRKHPSGQQSTEEWLARRNAADMADFMEYLAGEIWECLPGELRTLTHRKWREDGKMQKQYTFPLTLDCLPPLILDPSIEENLQTYDLIAKPDDLESRLPSSPEAFLLPVLSEYITPFTIPPPKDKSTRTDHCEICGRWWIPLSYHHLIPRAVHEKAVKRQWHAKEDLQNVAWLCGACHKFVHQFKTNEELARDFYTVELLTEQEEVQKWANWVGKLRWKAR